MNLQPLIEKRIKRSHRRRVDKLSLITHLRLPNDVLELIKTFYLDTIRATVEGHRDIINYLFTFGRYCNVEAYESVVEMVTSISDAMGGDHESCLIDYAIGEYYYDLEIVDYRSVVKQHWKGQDIFEQPEITLRKILCTCCGNYRTAVQNALRCRC